MPSCAAINCTNRQFKGCGRTFHLFPFGRPSLLQQWMLNMKRDKWAPSKKAVLCSHHFEVACFDRSGQTTRLRTDAVPTIFNFAAQLRKSQHPPRKLPKESVMNQPEPLAETPPTDSTTPSNNPESSDKSKAYTDDSYLAQERPRSVKKKLNVLKDTISELKKGLKTTQQKSCRLRKKNQHASRKLPRERVTSQSEPLEEMPTTDCATPSNNPESPDASKVYSDHSYLTQESPWMVRRKLSVLEDRINDLKKRLKTTQQEFHQLRRKSQHPPRKRPKEGVINQPKPLVEIPSTDPTTPSNNPKSPDASNIYSDHSYLTQESPRSVKRKLSVLKDPISQLKKYFKTTKQKSRCLQKKSQHPSRKPPKESIINQPKRLAEIPTTDPTTPSNNPESPDASNVYSEHSYLTQESLWSGKRKLSAMEDTISQLKKRLKTTQQKFRQLRKKSHHPPRKPTKERVTNQSKLLAEISSTDCITPSNFPECPDASKVYSDHSYLTQENPWIVKRKLSVLEDRISQLKKRLKSTQQKSRRLQKKGQRPPRKPLKESVINQPESLAEIPLTDSTTPSNNPESPDTSKVYLDHSYLTQESSRSVKRKLSVLKHPRRQLKKHLKTTNQKFHCLRKKSQHPPRKLPKGGVINQPKPLAKIPATDCTTPSKNPESPATSKVYSDHSYPIQERPWIATRKLSALEDLIRQLRKRLKTTQQKSCHLRKKSTSTKKTTKEESHESAQVTCGHTDLILLQH
uniref:THAP-type domain-containing protein n=1 Tax=Eptatretus burgeri TaxID=7764 RepID=A0A8C4WUU8_EPTBU